MTFTFNCVHTGLCTTPGGRVRARYCLTRKQNMWESQVGGLEIKGQNSPVTGDGDACGWIAAETHIGGFFRWKPFNSSRVECAFSLFWSKEEKGSKGCRGPGGSHTHKGERGKHEQFVPGGSSQALSSFRSGRDCSPDQHHSQHLLLLGARTTFQTLQSSNLGQRSSLRTTWFSHLRKWICLRVEILHFSCKWNIVFWIQFLCSKGLFETPSY